MVFGADAFEVEVVEGEKEKPAEAGEKFQFVVEEAAENEVEEVVHTRERAKGVETPVETQS
jgi:hypothetical protein